MSASTVAQVTPDRIMQFAWGYAPPLILESAIRNGIFDALDSGPKNLDELHAATGTSVRGLAAIANTLVGLNFLAKDDTGRFSLMPESAAFLVQSKPSFMGGMILHTSEQLIPKWLSLNEIVKTGKPLTAVNQEEAGGAFFEQLVLDIF
ncbi:MAG TPA: methyltransferase dimerization domain-containing protein, partial [Silvibacterium sp.]|nr:methyltransferase dimerization domain-containing protein [Silvibacterium sp.]